MPTLLEQAQKIKVKKHVQRHEINFEIQELAVAWAKGEVSLVQAGKALGLRNPAASTYMYLALGLRGALRSGILK